MNQQVIFTVTFKADVCTLECLSAEQLRAVMEGIALVLSTQNAMGIIEGSK